MKRKRVVLLGLFVSIGIWVLSVCVAFFVGARRGRSEILNTVDRVPIELRGEVGSGALERRAIIRKYGARGSTTSAVGRSTDLRRALEGVLRVSKETPRRYVIGVIMSGLDASEIRNVVAFVEGLPRGPRQDEFSLALLGRWGMLDGRSALAFALERGRPWNRERAIAATLEGWASTDGGSAWKWVVENSGSDPFESTRLAAVVIGLMRADPGATLPRVAALKDHRLLTSAGRALADVWFEEGVLAEEVGWFLSLETGAARDTILSHAVGLWSRYAPEEAADWLVHNAANGLNRSTLSVLAANWVPQDPEGAVSWVHALPEGELRRNGLEVAIDTWLAGGDMVGAADWLNEQPPHEDLDGSVRRVALNTLYEDPEAAMTWAVSIVDEALRFATMDFITSLWMSSAPDAASAYLDEHGLDVEQDTVFVGDAGVPIFRGEQVASPIALPALSEAAPPNNGEAGVETGSEDTGVAVEYILVEEEPPPTVP